MVENRKFAAPFVYLAIAIVAVSCSSILIRLTHTPALVIAFYRQAFSAILLFPFVRENVEEKLPKRDYALLVLSGLFLALHFATWITSLFHTTVARATLFVDLQPVWAAVLGAIFLSEKLTRMEVAGVLTVTVGGIVTAGPRWGQEGSALLGDLLATAGGISGACYLLIGRKVRSKISWLRYMYSVYYLSAIWLFLFHVGLSGSFPLPAERDLIWIIVMALVPSLLGHGLFNLTLRHFKAYVVNSAFLGEPILATILAYLFFGEAPDRYYYMGGALVFAGLAIVFLKQRRGG